MNLSIIIFTLLASDICNGQHHQTNSRVVIPQESSTHDLWTNSRSVAIGQWEINIQRAEVFPLIRHQDQGKRAQQVVIPQESSAQDQCSKGLPSDEQAQQGPKPDSVGLPIPNAQPGANLGAVPRPGGVALPNVDVPVPRPGGVALPNADVPVPRPGGVALLNFDIPVGPRITISVKEICGFFSRDYMCPNSSNCLKENKVCDGVMDCPDGSDEQQNCASYCAESWRFTCLNSSKCVSSLKKCDGVRDCPDGLDEEGCTNCDFRTNRKISCGNGSTKCIDEFSRCDGVEDCANGADEKDCDDGELDSNTNTIGPNPGFPGSELLTVSCTPPFEVVGSQCLYNNKGGSTWQEAQRNCQNVNGTLAEVLESQNTIIDFLESKAGRFARAWIARTNVIISRQWLRSQLPVRGRWIEEPDDAYDGCLILGVENKGFHPLNCTIDVGDSLCEINQRREFSCGYNSTLSITNNEICDGSPNCPNGVDELNCESYCSETELFKCLNSSKCVNTNKICDGVMDCLDGSDEQRCTNCDFRTNRKISCGNGSTKCIDELYRCDGVEDCANGADEKDCELYCAETEGFKCLNSSKCVNRNKNCDRDGVRDCPDGSDEQGCTFTCHSGRSFSCGDDRTECIQEFRRCNGLEDCSNGADEKYCGECLTRTGEREFFCGYNSSLCISNDEICDGTPNCPNGVDELNCELYCTETGDYMCPNSSKCLNEDIICDGVIDCPDGSDEDGCQHSISHECSRGAKRCNGVEDCVYFADEENCEYFCDLGRLCPNSTLCIFNHNMCDGKRDCPDGWDEQRCGHDECQITTGNRGFSCGYGSTVCIYDEQRCDIYHDCPNKEDELNCDGQFLCRNGTYIDNDKVCDNVIDCSHGEDEQLKICHEISCNQRGGSLCANSNICVFDYNKCDGKRDCPDGSDEQGCSRQISCDQIGGSLCANSNICVFDYNKCDGKRDCPDGSDEQGCSRHYQVGLPAGLPSSASIPTTFSIPSCYRCKSWSKTRNKCVFNIKTTCSRGRFD